MYQTTFSPSSIVSFKQLILSLTAPILKQNVVFILVLPEYGVLNRDFFSRVLAFYVVFVNFMLKL